MIRTDRIAECEHPLTSSRESKVLIERFSRFIICRLTQYAISLHVVYSLLICASVGTGCVTSSRSRERATSTIVEYYPKSLETRMRDCVSINWDDTARAILMTLGRKASIQPSATIEWFDENYGYSNGYIVSKIDTAASAQWIVASGSTQKGVFNISPISEERANAILAELDLDDSHVRDTQYSNPRVLDHRIILLVTLHNHCADGSTNRAWAFDSEWLNATPTIN